MPGHHQDRDQQVGVPFLRKQIRWRQHFRHSPTPCLELLQGKNDLFHANNSLKPPLLAIFLRFWSWSDQGGGSALGWRVLLSMAQAMVPGQQAAAWSALKSLPIDASDGFALCGTIGRLSRTAAKWWIATRPSA